MIFPSIRAKVLSLAIIPTTAASLIFFSYFVAKQNNDIETSLTSKGNDIASHLATASEYGIFSGNLSLLDPLVDSTFKKSNVISITITDDQGTPLTQRHVTHTSTQGISNRNRKNVNHIFSKPVIQNPIVINDFSEEDSSQPTIIGWVTIEISNDLATQRKREATTETLLITLAILISSIYLATMISRRITSPITTLTNAVKEIEDGNLDVSISTYSTGELQSLEQGIRGMLISIKTSQQDSQQKIEQATIELRESLELLECKNYDLTIAQKSAQSASRAKSFFLANISHEIRTPMNGILGFVKLLNNTSLTREQADYLRTIEQSAHNLLHIINDVLDLSKVEAGKLVIKKTHFNLRECIEDVEILVSPSAIEKGLEIATIFYDDTPEYIIGPQDRVRQVLINLVGNAIKFSDKGIIIIRAMIEERNNDTAIIKISVSDQGPGVSEKNQQILFDSFTQLDESDTREHGGAGLGLSISKSLAKAMNGEIGVESQKNNGSTFWFSFESIAPEDSKKLNDKKPFIGTSIGVYDSNELSLTCISHIFRRLGFTVFEYPTTNELNIHLEGQDQPDIFALNLRPSEVNAMPSAVQKLSSQLSNKTLAIINKLDSDTAYTFQNCGINNYIARPFRITQLITALNKILRINSGVDDDQPASQHKPSQRRLDGVSILIAEDNPINAKFISTILERSGAETIIANNGKIAVSEFAHRKYDAILMDIHMPVMDGIEATKKIRALEDGKHKTPILGLTAIDIDDKEAKYINAGLDNVLEKPVAVDDLLNEIALRVFGKKSQHSNWPDSAITRHADDIPSRPSSDEKLVSTMNEMLLTELPNTRELFIKSYLKKDWDTLRNEIHRFIGGISYCDVPKLHALSITFQKSLKSQDNNLSQNFDTMIGEIDSMIATSSIH